MSDPVNPTTERHPVNETPQPAESPTWSPATAYAEALEAIARAVGMPDEQNADVLFDALHRLGQDGRNVPQGTYRNHLGVELAVGEVATASINGWPTLGADIAVAHQYDSLLGDRTLLVTERSLRLCGYTRVEAQR